MSVKRADIVRLLERNGFRIARGRQPQHLQQRANYNTRETTQTVRPNNGKRALQAGWAGQALVAWTRYRGAFASPAAGAGPPLRSVFRPPSRSAAPAARRTGTILRGASFRAPARSATPSGPGTSSWAWCGSGCAAVREYADCAIPPTGILLLYVLEGMCRPIS